MLTLRRLGRGTFLACRPGCAVKQTAVLGSGGPNELERPRHSRIE
jgi:hypothetical protein